jgi:hypothetical protein
MAHIAIDLLWLLFWAIVLGGVLWLFIYGIDTYIRKIPEQVKSGIWFLALIIVLIAAITVFMGGNVGSLRPFR